MCIVESGEDEELKALSEAFCFLRLKKKHELVVITGLDVHVSDKRKVFAAKGRSVHTLKYSKRSCRG